VKEIGKDVEIIKILQEQKATGGVHKVSLQSDNVVRQIPCTLNIVDLANQTISFGIPENFRVDLEEHLHGGEQVKAFLEDKGAIFFSRVINYKSGSGTIVVEFPKVLFLEERRKEERYRPAGILKVSLSTKDQLGSELFKDILDISKGGMSFVLNKGDRFPFTEEENLSIKLVYKSHSLECSMKVVKILKIKPFVLENIPYGDRLVSLSFSGEDETLLKRVGKLVDSLFSRG